MAMVAQLDFAPIAFPGAIGYVKNPSLIPRLIELCISLLNGQENSLVILQAILGSGSKAIRTDMMNQIAARLIVNPTAAQIRSVISKLGEILREYRTELMYYNMLSPRDRVQFLSRQRIYFPRLNEMCQATGLFEVFGENNWYPNGQPKADLDERGQLRSLPYQAVPAPTPARVPLLPAPAPVIRRPVPPAAQPVPPPAQIPRVVLAPPPQQIVPPPIAVELMFEPAAEEERIEFCDVCGDSLGALDDFAHQNHLNQCFGVESSIFDSCPFCETDFDGLGEGEREAHVDRCANGGGEKVVLEKEFPFTYSKVGREDGESCAICFEDYLVGEDLTMLSCHCLFHIHCFQDWRTRPGSFCPQHR